MGSSHGRAEIGENSFFKDKTVGAALRCGPSVSLLFVYRQNDDFNVGPPRFDPACGLEAVQARHGDIHKNDFRPQFVIESQGLFAVFGFTDEIKVAFLFGKPSYGSAKARIVIDEK